MQKGRLVSVFSLEITPTKQDIDVNGHVNNVVYVQWMQNASVAHSRFVGETQALRDKYAYTWVIKTHTINYAHPIFLGDKILLKTWVEAMKISSSVRNFEFVKNDIILATAQTIYVTISTQTLRPIPTPKEVKALYPVINL